jgi:hypothetical protein
MQENKLGHTTHMYQLHYISLIFNPERNRPLGGPVQRWEEDNIKMDLRGSE